MRPVQKKARVILACVVMFGWLLTMIMLTAIFPAIREFAKSVTPDILTGAAGGGPAFYIARIWLLVILAPLAEELFFRGWIWEALRRSGHGTLSVICLSVMPWLLLHGIDSPGGIVFLLLAAIVYSAARHTGGSVLASLVVHIFNNLGVVAVQIISAMV